MIGGGLYGHLGLILFFHVYNTLIPTQPGTNAWIDPVNPGITPAFPPGGSNLVITTIKAQHAELKQLWRLSQNVNTALCMNILAAVDPIYLRAIKKPHIG